MQIIKLNATDSTNRYLKHLIHAQELNDFTTVVAKTQTDGRGQMGTVWTSESSKNLTFSVFKEIENLPFNQQFYISIVTALALVKTLQSFSVPKLKIKWPNDILSEQQKISGILIENVIKKDKMYVSVIGVGLNVNQTQFDGLPSASSLKLIMGQHFDLDEVLTIFLEHLKSYFNSLERGQFEFLKSNYENLLFRKGKPSTFTNAEGVMFSGFIDSVTESGNLKVRLEDDVIKTFGLKDVTLLY